MVKMQVKVNPEVVKILEFLAKEQGYNLKNLGGFFLEQGLKEYLDRRRQHQQEAAEGGENESK